MCSEKNNKGQYYINEQTQNKTLEVVQWLMEKYGVPLENVVRHYDVTGKLCPEPFVKSKEKTDCQNRNGFRQRRKNDI